MSEYLDAFFRFLADIYLIVGGGILVVVTLTYVVIQIARFTIWVEKRSKND